MTHPKEKVKNYENRVLRRIFGPKRKEVHRRMENAA
jgi:hypothetical protein